MKAHLVGLERRIHRHNIWRILEKTLMDEMPTRAQASQPYNADFSRVCDVLRGSMIADGAAQLDAVYSLLCNLDDMVGRRELAGGLQEKIILIK